MPSQLPLELIHPPQYGRDSFVVGAANADALALIESWPDWPSRIAIISGPAGSGKSHLTHIWAERANAGIILSSDLETEPMHGPLPAPIHAAVEDIDPERVPERALFHLINSVREGAGSLLLTARGPASNWRIELPDLRSRLRMATPALLAAPDDNLLRKLLVKLFADRQLIVEKAVIDYLLLRMERSLQAAVALVKALDREALAAGRSISRPMAARILGDFGEEAGEFADPQ